MAKRLRDEDEDGDNYQLMMIRRYLQIVMETWTLLVVHVTWIHGQKLGQGSFASVGKVS